MLRGYTIKVVVHCCSTYAIIYTNIVLSPPFHIHDTGERTIAAIIVS